MGKVWGRQFKRAVVLGIGLFAECEFGFAGDRTIAWSPVPNGNLRYVGMAGANTALTENFFAAGDNPGGLAMTLPGVDLQWSSNRFMDDRREPGVEFSTNAVGMAVPIGSYGVSLGYSEPFKSSSNEIREWSFGLAGRFMEDRLGVGLLFAPTWDHAQGDFSEGVTQLSVGAQWRFPHRILLGGRFSPRADGESFTIPSRAALGIGYIPNRSFRVGAAIKFANVSENPFQLHLGFAYNIWQTNMIRTNFFAGTYYESDRGHITFGIDFMPWIFDVSVALDRASGYENTIASIGLDLGATAQFLGFLPKTVPVPPAGLFPNPLEQNDDWLPRHLQDHPEQALQSVDPDFGDYKRTIKKLPGNLKNRVEQLNETLDQWLEE